MSSFKEVWRASSSVRERVANKLEHANGCSIPRHPASAARYIGGVNTVQTASAHMLGGRRPSQSSSIGRAFALCVWIILSDAPILCCAKGGDGSKVIPCSTRIDRNEWLLYSPLPLSHWNRVIRFCCSLDSNMILNSRKTWHISIST